MSAFLGPIHYRMFAKALSVDGIARAIADHADAQGWTSGLRAELDAGHPRLTGEITDHIDLSQIHGSLSLLVSASEEALAAACAPLSDHMDELVAFARELGASAARDAELGDTLQSVWGAMDEHWLDGMPCDGYLRVTSNTPASVAWTVALAPHAALGYERIRTAWMEGFLSVAHVRLTSEGDGAYRMERAA